MNVLGLRVKTGWAAVVLIGGTRAKPQVLDSREIRLSDWDTPHGRQPYHATFGTAQTDRAVIARLVKQVEHFALRALGALLRDYRAAGHRVTRGVIVVSSLTDPETIANQHMRAHASEGQLYRLVVDAGLRRLKVRVTTRLEREVRPARQSLRGEGRWRAEQKHAAGAALGCLPSRPKRG